MRTYMTLKNYIASGTALALVATFAASPLLVSAESKSKNPSSTATTVSIGGEGRVLVRGAEVTAVTDSTIIAETAWGNTSVAWTLETNDDTTFITLGGANTSRGTIDEGETISFSGRLDERGAFFVDADVVRNWSEGERNKTVSADVKADASHKKEGFWGRLFGGIHWGGR